MISNVAQHKSKNGVLAPYWDSALIEKTASGAVASFADGADGMPMVSVLANIEPKQAGTGDPSPDNVRPISGWDSVNVTRSGKNLLRPHAVASATVNGVTYQFNADGSITITGTPTSAYAYGGIYGVNSTDVSMLSPLIGGLTAGGNLTLTIEGNPTGIDFICQFNKANGTLTTTRYTASNIATTVPSDAVYMFIAVRVNRNTVTSPINCTVKCQITNESTATAYKPYVGQTYPTTLPQTVYGGSLDVVSGVLTIDKALVDMGTLTWLYNANGFFYADYSTDYVMYPNNTMPNWLCSSYKVYRSTYPANVGGLENGIICPRPSNRQVQVRDTRYTDATDFTTAVTGIQLVMELASPQTIQLTPTEVDSLLADNNVWADSGNIAVTYRADTTLAYNQLTNAIVSLGGNI